MSIYVQSTAYLALLRKTYTVLDIQKGRVRFWIWTEYFPGPPTSPELF
jgi:hypothetical protein